MTLEWEKHAKTRKKRLKPGFEWLANWQAKKAGFWQMPLATVAHSPTFFPPSLPNSRADREASPF